MTLSGRIRRRFRDIDHLLVSSSHSDRYDDVLLELFMTLLDMRPHFAGESIAVYWYSAVSMCTGAEGYGAAIDEACVRCHIVMPAVSSGVRNE